MLFLQEFDYEVKVRAGKHHDNANFLSRFPGAENEDSLEDYFPDEHIWHIKVESSKYKNKCAC